jgi:hypothetical protein
VLGRLINLTQVNAARDGKLHDMTMLAGSIHHQLTCILKTCALGEPIVVVQLEILTAVCGSLDDLTPQ